MKVNVNFNKNEFKALETMETARQFLNVRLVNKKKCVDEVYRSARYYGFPDLVIVPVITTDVLGSHVTMKITEEVLKSWGVTKRKVIDAALANVNYTIEDLKDRLAKMMGGLPDDFESPFIVVSNESCFYGAVAILKARKELDRMFPGGYYVIPSSVHEVLVLPKHLNIEGLVTDEDEIKQIINEVNTHVLEDGEYLSDQLYSF